MNIYKKNRFRTDMWKEDSALSVDLYNNWFMHFAPKAFRDARKGVEKRVMDTFRQLHDLRDFSVEAVLENQSCISVLRACTAPMLALDRLAGLSGSTRGIINSLEHGRLGKKGNVEIASLLPHVLATIQGLLDVDIFPWLRSQREPTSQMRNRSAAIVADRITGASADPIIRNSQELRQFEAIERYLKDRGYEKVDSGTIPSVSEMEPHTYSFHVNVPVRMARESTIKMPVDVVIKPKNWPEHKLPLLIECKSAGDYANTNKRRKEEAQKVSQLRAKYGEDNIVFILFLCGYFDVSYLGYEASENIDWVWEHRIDDFEEFGI